MKKPGSQAEAGSFLGFESSFKGTGVSGYPGGPFNPLGLGNSSKESMDDFKWREIRNGRLAMFAFLGFVAQHAATGKGPIENLVDHLAVRGVGAQRHAGGRAGGGSCHFQPPARVSLCCSRPPALPSPPPTSLQDPWAANFCSNGTSLPVNIF